MSKRPSPPNANEAFAQESDIIVHPNGDVSVSFLWNDLVELLPESDARRTASAPAVRATPARALPAPGSLAFPIDEYRSCQSCPKRCGFDRVAQPHRTCGTHELRISNAGLTFGDEPEIRGTRGSGAVMLAGCPLRCRSCHNPEKVGEGRTSTLEEFVALAFSLQDEGAHNLQILSPTVHFPALRVALRELRRLDFGIPVVFKTSGYERGEELRSFEGLVDVYLPDLKFGPCSSWAAQAGVRNYFAVASSAIAEMIRQAGPLQLDPHGVAKRGVLVRHVKAPLPEAEFRILERFLAELPTGVGVSVQEHFVNLE